MSTGHQDALLEAVDYEIEENAHDKHRWEKLKLPSSLMLEPVDASAFEGVKVLPTRSVDTVGKSRFVAKGSKTSSQMRNDESLDRCRCNETEALTTGNGQPSSFPPS